jgi:hypothetical protein
VDGIPIKAFYNAVFKGVLAGLFLLNSLFVVRADTLVDAKHKTIYLLKSQQLSTISLYHSSENNQFNKSIILSLSINKDYSFFLHTS